MAFDLELPDEKEVKEQVEQKLAISEERERTVQEAAREKVEQIMGTDITVFEDRKSVAAAFEEFGSDVIRKTEAKNGILSKRMVEFSRGSAETGEVAKGLAELSAQMKTLDPSAVNFEEKGLFGKIANPVKRYFDKYKTADAEIADIVKSLDSGKKMLQNDNVTLELEEQELFGLSKQLNVKGHELTFSAERLNNGENVGDGTKHLIRFFWDDCAVSFSEVLEACGEIPIPPYLNRKTEESDLRTYQTVYSKVKGSVAAPTAPGYRCQRYRP